MHGRALKRAPSPVTPVTDSDAFPIIENFSLAYSRPPWQLPAHLSMEKLCSARFVFSDRATFALLTGLAVADTESICAVAGVSLEPSRDVVRISCQTWKRQFANVPPLDRQWSPEGKADVYWLSAQQRLILPTTVPFDHPQSAG
jgi:hypothetical protein